MSKPWLLSNPFAYNHKCNLPIGNNSGLQIWYQLPQVMRTWCDTNLQGQYWWEPGSKEIYFEFAQDAMMFQLRWL